MPNVVPATAHRPEIALPELRPFINNAFVDARANEPIEVRNPATGEVIATVQGAGAADVDEAVKAARAAFESDAWSKMPGSKRAKLLRSLGDLIEKNKEELSRLESLNNGKLYRESLKGDLPPTAEIFHYMAGWATKLHGTTIPVDGPYLNYTLREPVGVCAQVIPWNFPLLMAGWKLAPALAAGNTVVLKPSEITPLSALKLAELIREAGFPPGVVNILPGFGPTAGDALARHMDVDKLAFTGSTRTGRALLKASSESNLKRLSLELGGKSPNIVFADADQKPALSMAMWAIFMNKGELCSAGSRLLVQESIHDEFVGKLAERVAKLKVGDPFEPGVDMGATVSELQLQRVLSYIEQGKASGAKVLTGGARETAGDKGRGYFIQPTIFDGVDPKATIAQEEIFGPVLSVLTFKDEADAIRIANDAMYGLVSAVWTKDVGRAHRVARALKAGTVWINDYNAFDAAAPFGGYKLSGWGREMGEQVLANYTETKDVWVRTDR